MNKNITIIGIGRLGLCMCLCLESKGYNVLGIDTDKKYIDKINKKTLQSFEPSVEDYLKKSKNFIATKDLQKGLEHSNLIFIYVPTPTKKGENNYDDTILCDVLKSINKFKVENKNIIIGCTIYPTFTKNKGICLLSDCKNTNLIYNPEFIAQGDIMNGIYNSDIVLIGAENKKNINFLENIYRDISPSSKICIMSTIEAEITKLSINCFITTKICFANLIGDIADKSNCDPGIILETIGIDSRIGNKCLKYGYGYGGPFFPRDNRVLDYYSHEIGIKNILSHTIDVSNSLHLEYQFEKIKNQNINYLFEDVCYKDNCKVPIIEESQKLALAEQLAKTKHMVTIFDYPHIIEKVKEKYGNIFLYKIRE